MINKIIDIRDYLNDIRRGYGLCLIILASSAVTVYNGQILATVLLFAGALGFFVFRLSYAYSCLSLNPWNPWIPFVLEICVVLLTLFCLLNCFSSETYYLKHINNETKEVYFHQIDKLGEKFGIEISSKNKNFEYIENEDGSITQKRTPTPTIKYEKTKQDDGTFVYIPITE